MPADPAKHIHRTSWNCKLPSQVSSQRFLYQAFYSAGPGLANGQTVRGFSDRLYALDEAA